MKIGQKIFQAISFCKYLFFRTNVQVLHSPFVYKLYTQCIVQDSELPEFALIEKRRSQLLNITTCLAYTDAGAGSSSATNKTIRSIARNSLKPSRQARLLGRFVQYFNPREVLELGTSFGITTAYLAHGGKHIPGFRLTTIEGIETIANLAFETFGQFQFTDQIQFRRGLFDQVLPSCLAQMNQVDFAFIDGNHHYHSTIAYFELLAQKSTNETILIFDDIHWSPEMEKAWEFIKNDARVTVTIDLYYLGLVFFRQEQAKEHFCLKF
jgi:predicted O-methyltransferase YrrM